MSQRVVKSLDGRVEDKNGTVADGIREIYRPRHHSAAHHQLCPVPVVISLLGKAQDIGKCHCGEADYVLYRDSLCHDALTLGRHNAI